MARKRKSCLEIYADELDEITEEKLKKKYNFPEDKPIEKKHRMNIKKEETLATKRLNVRFNAHLFQGKGGILKDIY